MPEKGQIEVLVLLIVVIAFAVFVSGGLLPNKEASPFQGTVTVNNRCCDNSNCAPGTTADKTILYPQNTANSYGLLKSNITLTEGTAHLKEDLATRVADNTPVTVYVNDTQSSGECGGGGKDHVTGPNGCVPIEDDEIIYVCVGDNCPLQQDSVYDVYFKLENQIPDIIKQCNLTPIPQRVVGTIVEPTIAPEEPRKNLQLKTLTLQQVIEGTTPWLSPWCKPAIYLYPKEKTDIQVAIAPKGKLTLTIPRYDAGGWHVTAYPGGNISYQDRLYDYLYYEAQIPDLLIEKPKEGFVLSYGELANFFQDLLPKLGLNEKETSQFSDYWLKSLPKSLYYFVGIVPADNLDTIAPITIDPSPNTIIRVTLYFEALSEKAYVNQPIITPSKRSGFSVVEWGGIVKTDPSHPFSCLM